ncbi:putative trehalose monomycolate exporter MmpL3, partial [Mycobacterium marinum]
PTRRPPSRLGRPVRAGPRELSSGRPRAVRPAPAPKRSRPGPVSQATPRPPGSRHRGRHPLADPAIRLHRRRPGPPRRRLPHRPRRRRHPPVRREPCRFRQTVPATPAATRPIQRPRYRSSARKGPTRRPPPSS